MLWNKSLICLYVFFGLMIRIQVVWMSNQHYWWSYCSNFKWMIKWHFRLFERRISIIDDLTTHLNGLLSFGLHYWWSYYSFYWWLISGFIVNKLHSCWILIRDYNKIQMAREKRTIQIVGFEYDRHNVGFYCLNIPRVDHSDSLTKSNERALVMEVPESLLCPFHDIL